MTDLKTIIKTNAIEDCPVTLGDLELAQKIYGPDIASLKGKTTRRKPKQAHMEDEVAIPQELIDAQGRVDLSIDTMFVNGMAFMTSVSHRIMYRTVEYVPRRTMDGYKLKLNNIKRIYDKAGFTLAAISADNEFAPLQSFVNDELHATLNIASANEHVIKERCRAIYNTLPFANMPKVMVNIWSPTCSQISTVFQMFTVQGRSYTIGSLNMNGTV